MIVKISGNTIKFLSEESDKGKTVNYTLPDGYTLYKYMFYRSVSSITIFACYNTLNQLFTSNNIVMTCPIVNSMSPNNFTISFSSDTPANSWIELFIIKFGGIPNPHYFDKAFEPILVKSKDKNGNEIEYNMIPSTQFER